MPQFYAITTGGLVDVLEKEIHDLGITITEKTSGGVYFDGNWEACYRVNLNSRVSSRVLKPIQDFTAYQGDELYHHILKHDFTKYINPDQTIKVEAQVKDCMLHDQRFVAMKTKDAIVDQFREKTQVRPDVDTDRPDLRIFIRGYKNRFRVAIDTSGESLFMRGYRKHTGEAPIKEHLAAGLIKLTEWDQKTPIYDPLCGSGTFLIEAALMALNISPGSFRNKFGFMKLKGYQSEVWQKVLNEALDAEKETLDFPIVGFDIDKKVIQMAKENARRAGVEGFIQFRKESVATFSPKEGMSPGLIITNPPYGARVGDEDNLRDVYRDLSFSLKHRFKGWTAWVLSGNKDLILDLKLKATRRWFVFNGPIECRFLKYEMF